MITNKKNFKNYVRILCICHKFIFGSKRPHSILDFHKKDIILMRIWIIYTSWNITFSIYIVSTTFFNKNIIKTDNIYVSTTIPNINHVNDKYMDDIAHMICELHNLNMNKSLIYQKYMIKISDIYVIINVSLLQLIIFF